MIKWLKMSTSGRPDKSCQMESMKNGQKVPKNTNLLNKIAQNAHFWSPCFVLINAKLVFIRQIEKGLLKCTLEWHLLLMIHISKMANAAWPTKCLSRDYRWIHTALHSIFRNDHDLFSTRCSNSSKLNFTARSAQTAERPTSKQPKDKQTSLFFQFRYSSSQGHSTPLCDPGSRPSWHGFLVSTQIILVWYC